MINSAGDFGPMLFGTGERLLLPFGLHHILVALIRFTDAGGTQEVCGQTVSGALTIFRAQLSCPTTHGFSESATRFLSQGKMPAFLGGLPGAALAMYHCARPENRHKIKGLLISGLIACVVGGDRTAGIPVPVRSASSVCHPRAVNRPRLHRHVCARRHHR